MRDLLGKQYMPAVISMMVLVGTFTLYGTLLVFGNPGKLDDVLLGRILGTADTTLAMVMGYWIGTTARAQQKDDIIKELSTTATQPAANDAAPSPPGLAVTTG